MRNQKRKAVYLLSLFLLLSAGALVARAQEQAAQQQGDEQERAEIQVALQYVPAERIEKLKAFINAHPNSALKARAQELIISARATWGDEKLRTGDSAGGLEQFRQAISDAPDNMTDKLYSEVISKIPYNLYLLGQRAGAMEVAKLIEARVNRDSKRLLMLVDFYTRIEEGQEATRLSEMAVRLAPDMAAAHMALGLSRHISLQLDAAAAEYARALELDPKQRSVKLSLANLRRATGRAQEALALYRELLASEPTDKFSRSGVVLSLLDLGKRDEAASEMEAALKDDPRNLPLLVGAAYWYAAHGEAERALALAQKAVEIEPRYVWAQVSLARALIALGRPLAAEQSIRFARRYGRFPTLDYELATALAAAGLYNEAAAELQRSFTLKGNQIETQLAGRTPARSSNFIELLGPERRASIFQDTAADTESNAQMLRALLSFSLAIGEAGKRETLKEKEAVRAAQEFVAGEDKMRAFRQLYVAERFLRAGLSSQAVLDFAEGASRAIDSSLDAPAASVAVLADELYSMRLQAITNGTTPSTPEIEQSLRANILKGRVEDIMGWTLYNQDNAKDAIVRLRQATTLLPENSNWWRTSMWHLGAALEANGEEQEALATYLRGYDKNAPDIGRRAIIERLYRKLNGSLEGLEAKLGATPATTPPAPASDVQANNRASTTTETKPATDTSAKSADDVKQMDALRSTNEPSSQNNAQPATNAEVVKPTPQPEAPSSTQPATQTETAATTTDTKSATAEAKKETTNQPVATPEPTPEPAQTTRARKTQDDGACAFSIDVDTITIKNNGGTGIITVSLTGTDKITPTTRDWPDITVFAQTLRQSGVFPFLITSISKRTGSYTVNFTTPCGSKDVTVIVK